MTSSRGARPDRRGRRGPAAQPAFPDLPEGGVPTGAGLVTLERTPEDPQVVLLRIDGIESSALHLGDPTVLDFEYMELMTRLLGVLRPEGPVRALHLGGAGCALPRAWAALRPRSRQLVAEVDPDLARLAREWFDLPRSPELRIRVGDARDVVRAQRPGAWQVVVRDAFADGFVPRHLATVEFVAEVHAALEPGGLYLVNVAEGAPLRGTRGELRALTHVFGHVALVTDPAILSGRRHGNLVLAACDEPIDAGGVDRAMRSFPLPLRVLDDAGCREMARSARLPRDPQFPGPASLADGGSGVPGVSEGGVPSPAGPPSPAPSTRPPSD